MLITKSGTMKRMQSLLDIELGNVFRFAYNVGFLQQCLNQNHGTVNPDLYITSYKSISSKTGLLKFLFTLIVLPAIIVTEHLFPAEIVRLNEASHSFEVYTAIRYHL